tara:strand:- start:701 stop:1030 length:330 start_codon:yes stop_codon:yes gene_type:complete
MAFVLKKSNIVKWPITFQKAADGGKFKKQTFTAVFKEVGRDQFNELVEKGDIALVNEILLGWEGIQDEEKIDVPFSDENKAILLDDFAIMKAIIETYGQVVCGGGLEKN